MSTFAATLTIFYIVTLSSTCQARRLRYMRNVYEPDLSNMEEVMARDQRHRLGHIDEVCRSYFGKPKMTYEDELMKYLQRPNHMYVLEKYKILACLNPKVGATNLRSYLIQMAKSLNGSYSYANRDIERLREHGDPQVSSRELRRLSTYDAETIAYMARNYFKMTFVRDPLSRLLSAWKNKLAKDPRIDEMSAASFRYSRAVATKVLRIAKPYGWRSRVRQNRTIPVSITEFFTHLTASSPEPSKLNGHWQPFIYNCMPCHLEYDFVGRLENFGPEIEYFARNVTGSSIVPPAATPPDRYMEKQRDLAKLSKELIDKVLKRYYTMDYLMFGYEGLQFDLLYA